MMATLRPLAVLPLLCACAPNAFDVVYSMGVAGATVEKDRQGSVERDDAAIQLAVGRAWLDAGRRRFADVESLVRDGRVIVFGHVNSVDDHIEALRLAWSVGGVKAVTSDVTVDGGDPAAQLEDTNMATTIVGRITDDPSVDADHYSIQVSGESVYLLGKARNQAELNRVIRHARSAGNARRIVTLVHVGGVDA